MTSHQFAVEVRGLTKKFRIFNRPSDRIRDLFRLNRSKRKFTEFTAVKDLSFKIEKGKFIGVVGKNGSGKSTLLKILSGELSATQGEVSVHGAIALLQLGVGFNPELTGIENVRFAAKIMGFNSQEIESVTSKVADFAEIGDFMGRPVKTYSSGMYSRLSFATAINIDPDILVADEVLAVGDLRFSQKCLRKMREFRENGKTVILVSHDIAMVSNFCDEVLWIKDGQLFMQGETRDVLEHFKNYMYFDKLPTRFENLKSKVEKGLAGSWVEINSHVHHVIGTGDVILTKANFSNFNKGDVEPGQSCELLINFKCIKSTSNFKIGFVVSDRLGQVSLHLDNESAGLKITDLSPQTEHQLKFLFKWPPLNSGTYSLALGIQQADNEEVVFARAHEVFEIVVTRPREFGLQHGLVLISNATAEVMD